MIFTQATLISAHVFLMFWLSRPQTCQCAYACTHRRAVGLGLEQGSFFPFFFSLKKQQKPHNCPAKSTPLCAPFPSTLPRDCRRAIIRLSHLETRLPFKASKQPDSTFPRVFAGAELHRPGMERQTSLATAFLSPGPPATAAFLLQPQKTPRKQSAAALS